MGCARFAVVNSSVVEFQFLSQLAERCLALGCNSAEAFRRVPRRSMSDTHTQPSRAPAVDDPVPEIPRAGRSDGLTELLGA